MLGTWAEAKDAVSRMGARYPPMLGAVRLIAELRELWMGDPHQASGSRIVKTSRGTGGRRADIVGCRSLGFTTAN